MRHVSYNVLHLVLLVVFEGHIGHRHTAIAAESSPVSSSTHSVTKREVENLYLLPKDIIPLHYTLRLYPEIGGNFTLNGSVQISLEVKSTTNNIVFHVSGDITVAKETLKVISRDNGTETPILAQNYVKEYHFYIVRLANYLEEGSLYDLQMHFSGYLSNGVYGFYIIHYTDPSGVIRYGAATQLQSTNARSVFPCFDEPEMRTTFDVILTRENNMTALSNMPLIKSININQNLVDDYFERSVPMSTYLLAFVISDFVNRDVSNSALKTKLKIWTRKEKISQTDFAAEVGMTGLIFLEKYFYIDFPLPKLDIVAVPQMGPNAMENWGLIISRESGLLHVVDEGSAAHMKWVAYLMAHELAHQWFGNLVTMKWWTELWLNEGFATYVGYRVVNEIKPSWQIMKTFVVGILQTVMKLDELQSSPPVRVEVHHPDDIRATFSKISYLKGGSILRMMQHFLGEKTFRKGLSLYLSELKYNCSEQDDLWYYMTKVAHQDKRLDKSITVKQIMDTWTLQAGFPVLHVVRSNETIHLSQVRFLINRKSANEFELSKLWWIPVTWVAQSKPDFHATLPKVWLDKRNHTIVDSSLNPEDWIIVNPKENGFYRVSYDLENWIKIINQLKTDRQKIHPINRAQLIDDALNLAHVGVLLDYETALSLLSYLKTEQHPTPWMAALNNLAFIDQLMQHTSHYGPFRDYLLFLIGPLYESLTKPNNRSLSVLEISLKENIVKWACHLGHQKCVQNAKDLFAEWRLHPNLESNIPASISEAIFCTAVREGGSDEWDFAWQRYLSSSSADEKESLFKSLSCSRQVWILQRFMETSFVSLVTAQPSAGVPKEDIYKVYGYLAHNPIGLQIVWQNIKENWVQIKNALKNRIFGLSKLIENSLGNFITQARLVELIVFGKRYYGHFASAENAVRQSIEKTEANIAWTKRSLRPILLWLKQQNFTSIFELNYFQI